MSSQPRLIRALNWLPATLWMGGIFYLSHQSAPLASIAEKTSAFFAHLGLYAGLAVLLSWALARGAGSHGRAPSWTTAAVAFALTVLYGVSDELHHAFVPGRVASAADVAADAAGALLGVLVASIAASLLKAPRARQ